MPNWCITDYVVFGDKDDIESLWKVIKNTFNTDCRVKNDFGNWWLGNILDLHGLDWQKYDCRGEITQFTEEGPEHNFYEDGKSHFMFQTSTAWKPCKGVFDSLKEFYPSVGFYYFAEEPGCDLLETNDVSGVFHPERIRLRITDPTGNTEEEYFSSEEEFLVAVNKIEKCPYGDYTAWWEFIDEMDCEYSGDSPYEIDFVKVVKE